MLKSWTTSTVLFTLWLATMSAHALNQKGLELGGSGADLFLNLDVSQSHDDNIFITSIDETSDRIFAISPSFRIEAQHGDDVYELTARAKSGRYRDSTDDDYDDYAFDVRALWQFARVDFKLNSSLIHGHDDRGTEGSESRPDVTDHPDEYDLVTIGGTLGLGRRTDRMRLELFSSASEKEYSNNRVFTRDRNYDQTLSGGTFYLRLAGRTSLLLEATSTEIEYTDATNVISTLDSTEIQAYAGITWQVTGKTTGTIKIGREEKDFESDTRIDLDEPSWDVQLEFKPVSYSTFLLASSNHFDETNGTGDAIERQMNSITWTHRWGSKLTTVLDYSESDELFSTSSREDETKSLFISANFSLRRSLDISFSAMGEKRESNAAKIPYERLIYMINIKLGI